MFTYNKQMKFLPSYFIGWSLLVGTTFNDVRPVAGNEPHFNSLSDDIWTYGFRNM